MAQMPADSCSCDQCDVKFGPHDARSPDGYCSFCAGSCFPPSEIGGKAVRVAMSPESRARLHAAHRVTQHLPHDPLAAGQAARMEVADIAVSALGPVVERGGKALLQAIKDKISGRS